MELILIVLAALLLVGASYLLFAYIHHFFFRFFGSEEPTFIKALKILAWMLIPDLLFSIPLFPGFELIGIVALFFAFHFIAKKYFPLNSIKQNLKVYASAYVTSMILAIVTILPLRMYIVEPFIVSGASMSPTFVHNDYLLVKKFDKKFDRGDIVVLRSPADPLDIFIERIVGMPNETINIENGKVVANGTPLEESYLSQPTFGTSTPFQLKENEYFVLGDNRASSSDSRYWGPVRKENIIGKIWVKVFP